MKDTLVLVGNQIRELRKERGLSQEQLGELANFHYSYIGRIERGEKNISLTKLAQIADALNVGIHQLFIFSYEFENLVAAQFPCRRTSGFFLPRMALVRDNDWQMQPKAVPPFIVQGAAKATNKKGRRYGLQPRLPFPKLSLTLSLMKKKRVVKPQYVLEGAAVVAERIAACLENSRLQRHGGLIRIQDVTIRVGKGGYRCPCCCEVVAECRAESHQPSLPLWHQDLMHYLALVSKHGIPEDDRPKQCPRCGQCERTPHRHSHYERLVVTVTCCEKICIFRFRCPDCGYVHSVIPAFLEPYMQMALDFQEELVEAAHQGATVEQIAETMQALPCGGFDEHTIASLIRGWNERIAQLESGLWAWLLARVPHLALPRSASLWTALGGAWNAIQERIPDFRNIRFLHGLNRLHFSMTVTAHA